MKKDLKNALAKSTAEQYEANWDKFKKFVDKHLKKSTLPASTRTVSLYVTYMHNNLSLKESTIRNHLSAITYRHNIKGFPSPCGNYVIESLLHGYRKCDPPPVLRNALTADVLNALVQSIHRSEQGYVRYLLATSFILMYHALLRCSEVAFKEDAPHALLSHQIKVVRQMDGEFVKITFDTFKHSKKCPPPLYVSATGDSLCPVAAVKKFIKWRNRGSTYFFCLAGGDPVSRSLLVKKLKEHLAVCGFKENHFNTHSLRIGKATDMDREGIPHEAIRLAGRWSSKAYLKYIKPAIIKI